MNRRFCKVGLAALLALAGCKMGQKGEKGSGTITTDSRPVAAFTEIEASAAIEVEVSIGAASPVEVRGDDNLVGLVVTEVDHGRLSVHWKSGVSSNPTTKIHVRARTAELRRLECSSAATLDAKGLKGGTLAIEASSGGVVHASGATTRLSAHASSGARIEAGDLVAEEVEASVSSGANATVTATRAIQGETSLGASLRVKGSPAKRAVSESTGANVRYE
jgi:hypothetical protein